MLFRRIVYVLGALGLVLGAAHLAWPDYEWGQGRDSYFRLGNSLTLASWLVAMQLVAVSGLALLAYHRERDRRIPFRRATSWIWLAVASLSALLSLAEITRFHDRLDLLEPDPSVYSRLVVLALGAGLVALVAWFLHDRLDGLVGERWFVGAWSIAWVYALAFRFLAPWMPPRLELYTDLAIGTSTVLGATLLLATVGGHALRPAVNAEQAERSGEPEAYAAPVDRRWVLIGVGGSTFLVICLQIVLFQMLNIFGDYVTANTVLSVALLGIAGGGVIGYHAAARAPMTAMIASSLLMPLAILVAFGTTVAHLDDSPLTASLLLALPFVCASTSITVAIARGASHLVYCIDLVGAALGALVVSPLLGALREEGSLLLLCAGALLVALCFIRADPRAAVRRRFLPIAGGLMLAFVALTAWNVRVDALNVVRTHMQQRYPDLEMLFSRSSFVGRYDVIRTRPELDTLKTVENGRIIDTVRSLGPEHYQVDPRIPHTIIENPAILIIGLSGDAITKTSTFLSDTVVGIEINPVVVELQRDEMRELNGASYDGIEVVTRDGRTYVERTDRQFDMITLMNSHFAKGYVKGRSASPEYLQTVEAFEAYLRVLTDRGMVVIEEPIGTPEREPQVWKLLVSMREALLAAGATEPERHFFVFQWKSRRNNYFQVLMKKTPYTAADLAALRQWLHECDVLPQTEREAGTRLGPIKSIQTVLYAPDEPFDTNIARVVEGRTTPEFVAAHNLRPITDDMPFPFDLNPARPETRQAYTRTLAATLLLLPFFVAFLRRSGQGLRAALPYVSVVGLTGMGYLLVEVVLIQRFAIFLGSPIVTLATVLGTLLIFSGLGSLWSSRVDDRRMNLVLGGLFAMLVLHLFAVPSLLGIIAPLSLGLRLFAAALTLAPLAFFMGVPFPFVLRAGKQHFSESSAAMLFAINAATSALAVPLALNISSAWGMRQVLVVAVVVYAAVALSLLGARGNQLRMLVNGPAYAVLGLLLVSPWLLSRPARAAPAADGVYEVYAASMGRSSHREDRVLLGGSRTTGVPFEWLFYIVKSDDRTILLDTGFDDPELARRWRIARFTPPLERLRQMGIEPGDVTDVVLTHTHWDHAGTVAAFPGARIYLQQAELEFARETVNPETLEGRGLRWPDVAALDAAAGEGRLVLVDGAHQVAPGFTVDRGGSHTIGSQYAVVETRDGKVVLGGDMTYLYWNGSRRVAIGTAVDHDENVATVQRLLQQAGSPFLLMPGHDPAVTRWFPEESDGIYRITMEVH